VGDLLLGMRPRLPGTVNPYMTAARKQAEPQVGLF
jgi:hypothetical protein